MLALFLVLALLALLLTLTCLEWELREWLLARRGLYATETLEERTGLDRRALHARLGPARPDGLRALSPARLAALPRRRRFDPWHPAPGAAAALGLAASLVQALRAGEPAWGWLLLPGGYVLAALAFSLIQLWREGLGPDDPDEEAERAGQERLLARLGRDVHEAPLTVSCVRVVAWCDQVQADHDRFAASCWSDPSMPLLPRLVTGVWASFEAWRTRRAGRAAEALLAEAHDLRRQAQALLDELDERERGWPETT